MTDAPKRIWAWVSDLRINGQPGGTLNQWHTSPPTDNPERAYPHIRAEAAALSEAPEVHALIADAVEKATRVKPLVWRTYSNNGNCDASTRFGPYSVEDCDEDGWGMWTPQEYGSGDDPANGYHPTLEAAKAAAQADYEQRIRAAIGGK